MSTVPPDAATGAGGASAVAASLALAAAPTFALMALLTALPGDPAAAICASAAGSPLGGMVAMYVLMSVFHAGPWLRLIPERRR